MAGSVRPGRRVWAVAIGAAAVGAVAGHVRAATPAFTASPTGDFDVAANWSTGTVPGPSDQALINNGGTATIRAGDDIQFARLTLGVASTASGSLVMEGGSLTAAPLAATPTAR